MKYRIPEVKITRLRECQVDNPIIETPDSAAAFWAQHVPKARWFDSDKETAVVLLLNTRRHIIGFTLIASGTLDTLLVHARELFKVAIVQSAAAVVLMHNHPSGDPVPSEPDIKITRNLVRAGEILKIEVLDHVIMGDKTKFRKGWCSLRELGYFADC